MGKRKSRGFEVISRQCAKCLMGPNRIVSGKRAAMLLAECKTKDIHFECHRSTMANRHIGCRGHYDTGVGQLRRIAERLGVVININPDTLERLPVADGDQGSRNVMS